MPQRLEEKWRAMPPERELQVRIEILVEEQRGLNESQERIGAAARGTKAYRLAERNSSHFLGRIARTQKRITVLRARIAAAEPASEPLDDARARKLRTLRQNSTAMLGRFLVVTRGHNAELLEKLGVADLGDVDVNTVLRAENIRLVSLDNPERWTMEGRGVTPQKFLALHPTDVKVAVEALMGAIDASLQPVPDGERAERATVIWLPRNRKKFQHPDPKRTVYQPRIDRLALDHRNSNSPKGWAILRGWGTDIDKDLDPINGCEVAFEAVAGKGRYEALLDPDEVEEILL